MILLLASVSYAQVPHVLNQGETITAQKLNENFDKVKINKWQEKLYEGNSTDFNFSNLTIGKFYRLTINVVKNTGSSAVNVNCYNGSDSSGPFIVQNYLNDNTGRGNSSVRIFEASNSNIFCTGVGGSLTNLANTTLEELNNYEKTSSW